MVDERAEQRDPRRDQLQVRAHVGDELHAHRGDAAIPVGRQLDGLDHAAPVHGGLGVLRALLGPADRPLQPLGDGEADRFFRVDVELGPETAAHRGRDDPHLVLGEAQHHRELDLEDVGDLGRRVDGDVAAVGLGDDAHAARLHRHRDEPLVHVPLVDRVHRIGERAVDGLLVGLELPDVRRVRAEIRMHEGAVAHRVFELERRRQLRVVDDDRFHRVTRGGGTLGDDDRDAVAHEAHLAHRERVVLRVLHVGGDRPRAGQRGLPVFEQVRAGEHGDDAGHRARRLRVDRSDRRVGERAADDLDVERAGDRKVVDEARLAGEEHGVLTPELRVPTTVIVPLRPQPSPTSTMF